MLTPAIMSAAIEDALSDYGVQITSLPISGGADRGVGERRQDVSRGAGHPLRHQGSPSASAASRARGG